MIDLGNDGNIYNALNYWNFRTLRASLDLLRSRMTCKSKNSRVSLNPCEANEYNIDQDDSNAPNAIT